MDELAVRTLLNSLEASRSSLHVLLHIFTWFVVVGLGFDLFVIIKEFRDDWGEFRYGQIQPYENHLPKRPSISLLILALLGTALIVIGVAGELYVDVQAGKIETQIREANEKLLGLIIQEAGDAKASAKTAHKEAEAAKDAAGKAQQRAGTVAKQTDELNRNLQAAKTQLATVDAKRAELEKSLINLAVCNAPRVISNWFLVNGLDAKSYVDSLRPMAGQMVFIEVVPDEEARRAASNIFRTLVDAKWNVQEPLKLVDGLADGVSVQPSLPTFTGLTNGEIPNMSPYWHATDVAEKLLEFLHSYNWQAEQGPPTDPQGKLIHDERVLPAGAIRIQIGLYPPAVYVSPPGQMELTSRMEEMKREQEKAVAESKRKREEQRATLPPEVRQKLQQADVEWEARTKRETSNSPCQVLNPVS